MLPATISKLLSDGTHPSDAVLEFLVHRHEPRPGSEHAVRYALRHYAGHVHIAHNASAKSGRDVIGRCERQGTLVL